MIYLWFQISCDLVICEVRQLTTLTILYHVTSTIIIFTTVKLLNFIQIIHDLTTFTRVLQLFCSNYTLDFCKCNNQFHFLFKIFQYLWHQMSKKHPTWQTVTKLHPPLYLVHCQNCFFFCTKSDSFLLKLCTLLIHGVSLLISHLQRWLK